MIEFSHVSFRYAAASARALKDVSFRVGAGELVVLTGRSGCGKSTLTSLVNGLLPRHEKDETGGAVTICGRDVSSLEGYEIARLVGSVFQNPKSQFFNLDTTGEIAFALENLGVPRDEMHARVARVADELGATDLLDRSIFKLSGGQMQSIAFASVSVCEPRAYVLDEPSSNLDPVGMERLAALIAKAKAAGSAVLVAEHRLAYLSDAADTYVLIEEGRVVHAWTPSEFKALSVPERTRMGLRSPAPPRTADLVARLRIGATSAFPALEARGVVAEYDRDDEVLRNMIYAGAQLSDLGFVVMDEVHYLSDPFRGPVWEEIIIHLHAGVRLISLSATVSNASDFASWLRTLRGFTQVVATKERPVPLQHFMIMPNGEIMPLFAKGSPQSHLNRELLARAAQSVMPRRGRMPRRSFPDRPAIARSLETQGLLPAIVFIFSRLGCEDAARQIIDAGVRLTTPEEAEEIRIEVETTLAHIEPGDLSAIDLLNWEETLAAGFASRRFAAIAEATGGIPVRQGVDSPGLRHRNPGFGDKYARSHRRTREFE